MKHHQPHFYVSEPNQINQAKIADKENTIMLDETIPFDTRYPKFISVEIQSKPSLIPIYLFIL